MRRLLCSHLAVWAFPLHILVNILCSLVNIFNVLQCTMYLTEPLNAFVQAISPT